MSTIDPATGEVQAGPKDPLERERMRVAMLEDDLRIMTENFLKEQRVSAGLRAQLTRGTRPEPLVQKATLIGEYYRARLGKSRAWKFGEKRQKAVVARLREEQDPLYICRAIDGLAEYHHVNSDTGVHYDDLELVCRDETNLERFYEAAIRNEVATLITDDLPAELGSELLPSDVLRRVSGDVGQEGNPGHDEPPEYDFDHEVPPN